MISISFDVVEETISHGFLGRLSNVRTGTQWNAYQ